MSANNQYFVYEENGMFYGWDTTAERTIADKRWRELSKAEAQRADSLSALESMLDMSGGGLGSEYGITAHLYLAKDGFPIKVVE